MGSVPTPDAQGIQVKDPSDQKNDQSIAVDPNESVGVAGDLKNPVGLKEASQYFFKMKKVSLFL